MIYTASRSFTAVGLEIYALEACRKEATHFRINSALVQSAFHQSTSFLPFNFRGTHYSNVTCRMQILHYTVQERQRLERYSPYAASKHPWTYGSHYRMLLLFTDPGTPSLEFLCTVASGARFAILRSWKLQSVFLQDWRCMQRLIYTGLRPFKM